MSFADLIAKKSASWEEEEYPDAGLPEPSRSGSLEAFIQKHGHVSETYKFYGDSVELRFNVDEWKYFRVADLGNLVPVNGVTNVVGIIDKSHMLTPWAAKMAIQKLLRIMPTEMVEGIIRIKPLTFEEFTVIALEAKGAHKEKLDEASDIGHIAHKCLEDSINFALTNDPEKIVRQLINIPTDEQAATAASGGFNWMQAHNVRWRETESKVYSREHNYAGTMDGLATCDSCNDKACCPVPFKDRLSLIDWKSSNHLKIEYLFQTASYRHAKQEEFPELHIIDTWILRLGKSEEEAGKFEPWHMTEDEYEEDFNGYLSCLSLTRLVDSVEERMKSQKSTIRAVKKEQKATAKALAKEQEKLQKALDKAAKKVEREAEKQKIKAEAKAEREKVKQLKKMGALIGTVNPADLPEGTQPRIDDVVFLGGGTICTSTSKVSLEPPTKLDSLPPQTVDLQSESTGEVGQSSPHIETPETPQPVAIILTAEAEKPAESTHKKPAESTHKPTTVDMGSAQPIYEEESAAPVFKLPME